MVQGKNQREFTKPIERCIAFVSLLILLTITTCSVSAASNQNGPTRTKADTSFRGWVNVLPENVVTEVVFMKDSENGISVSSGAEISAKVNISTSGKYALALTWRADSEVIFDSTAAVSIIDENGNESEVVNTRIYSLWQDKSKDYALDRYGNEITSEQIVLEQNVTDYVRDYTSMDLTPYLFSMKAGEQTIRIVNEDQGFNLLRIQVVEFPDIPSYETYRKSLTGTDYSGKAVIIEGEDYAVKSDSFIRSKAEQNPGVFPYSPYYKWLATVDGNSWNKTGQRVVWNFTVPSDGWYTVTFHYSQSSKEGQEVYRCIEIDGTMPFSELNQVGFEYTGAKYAYKQLNQKLYLTKGNHTIGLFTHAPDIAPEIEQVQAIIDELSEIGLNLQQVAGSSADKTRSWDIEKYIPGVTNQLKSIQVKIEGLYKKQIELNNGKTPASSLNLKLSSSILSKILNEPEKLPTKIDQISVGSGSVTNLLTEMINKWKMQGMSLDRIYLTGNKNELPPENGNIISRIINRIKRFFYALTSRNTNYAVTVSESTTLNVWVNRPVPYVETMQVLVDSKYNGYIDESGNKITVKFSIMPDEGKLLLANASNTCPDAALSVSGDRPYQLGLRGAAASLSKFADFSDYVSDKFFITSFEPYIHDGSIYAIPETQQFYVLMYRKDILAKMGLTVPKTWSDVANIMPALRRMGMNFYMPLSSWTGTKGLAGTAPFFIQASSAEGKDTNYCLWDKSGTRTNINNEIGIKSFQVLTNLYQLYGLQNNMPSFYNNFRNGVTPLGIGDFGNYLQILYAAPEIAGKWSVAPVPGFMGSDGKIHNQMITMDRSCIIMESSDKKEAAWDFLKWWLSDDTQIDFARTLQTKFGQEFVWNSANRNAFSKLSIPTSDKKVILQQWENAVNIRNLPATYMLERSLSDAWYNVVQSNMPVRIALNEAAVSIDQELVIKLQEFGYIDGEGKMLREVDMRPLTEILNG